MLHKTAGLYAHWKMEKDTSVTRPDDLEGNCIICSALLMLDLINLPPLPIYIYIFPHQNSMQADSIYEPLKARQMVTNGYI